MTGKRFTLYDGLDIKDNVTGEIIPPCLDKGLKRLIDLLNALNDENEQLRKDATTLIYSNQDYRKENEELKENCRNYNWYKEYKQLLNENEQLKAHNQYLIELLEHTGAIVEIQKGDEE